MQFQQVPSANLDLSNLGRIGFAGDFDGISLYEYEGQNGTPLSTNGSESLLAPLPNGALTSVISTDASIRAMCTFMLSNGDMQGVVIGGNFTSLDGTRSTAIALFNPNNTEITPLDGLEGEVNAIYCDDEQETVYVGGNFRGANSTNAIAWVGTDGWTNLPFAGFNGPVEAITKASNGHIIFGGTFTGLGNASTPTEPDNQAINLSTANITATNSVSGKDFGDPKNIVCSDGSDEAGTAWLVDDDTPGFWEAEFGFGFEPTKLRLANTHRDGRGTKTFRFIAFPISGIMNFTFVDPATGQNSSCSSECPLSDDPDVEFQDFHFVNRVGMDRFQIAISEWYGKGAGLSSISLYQDDIFAYAISDFNEPSCGVEFPASATTTGPWRQAPSLQSSSQYLTAELDGDISAKSASVIFTPSIRESGNYSVNMYTPGCRPDDTCSTRGRVNVTGTMSSGADDASFSTSLFQTNDFDKYDQIYFGYIEKTSDSFKPSVTLTPLDGQDVDTLTVVAQRVGFTLLNSTGGLNGLFDFDPSQAVINTTDFETSTINRLGASFDQRTGVRALVTNGDALYVAGNFTSSEHENIVAVTGNNDDDVKSLDGGLNGEVFDMYLEDGQLFVGGEFSNTLTNEVNGMNNVAVFHPNNNTWAPLGAGVDGRVKHVVPLRINITEDGPETCITLSGSFGEIRSFADNDAISVDGFAIWVPSAQNWLQNLDTAAPSYRGVLTAALLDLPTNDSIYAGSISSAQLSVNGAASLDDEGLGRFPVRIQGQSLPNQQLQRRDGSLSRGNVSGVVTGAFYDENDFNLTVLAGHFSARTANGSTVENLVIIDGKDEDSVSGLGSDISSDSEFVTVAFLEKTMYAGGRLDGNINGNDVSGIVSYDLESRSFGRQPASISGWNATVSVITVRPNNKEVFVAGSFERAGSLDCPGICIYDVEATQWNRAGDDLSGNITSLIWASDSKLMVGGDLRGNGSDERYLAIYDAGDRSWSAFPGADDIPGPVEVMTAAADSGEQIWIAGYSDDGGLYLMKYDGSKWIKSKTELGSGTIIRGMQVFSLTEQHDESDILDEKQALMLTGSIAIPDGDTVGAAIFNGTHFRPYALITSSSSSTGTIAKIFSQRNDFFSSGSSRLALGFVVLIGLAVALGLMFLLVLAGIILDRLRKRREGYTPAPTSMYDRGSGLRRIPPRELLESLGRGRPGAPHV
ncbi:cortical protein marker for cell polarity domain-containing protein [Sarocladium implicatum]|nr:cortical protein marker for cell polarity domain-containing protein [Sarocladium implicatum]